MSTPAVDYAKSGMEFELLTQISQIRQMQTLTEEFRPTLEAFAQALTEGHALGGLSGSGTNLRSINDVLNSLKNSIPDAPTLDLSAILSNAGSIGLPGLGTLQTIDPQVAGFDCDSCMSGKCNAVNFNFDQVFNSSPIASLLKPFREYVRAIWQVTGHPTSFSMNHASLSARVLLQRTANPEEFTDSSSPTLRFEALKKNWAFNGLIPTDLTGPAKDIAVAIAGCEAKLASWQQLTSFLNA